VNIVDPILFQCRINADQPAICAPGARLEAMTYAQLEFMLNALTRAVLTLGFERGQVVGVRIGNKILHVVLLLALARIGVVTVSCRERSVPKELGAVAAMTNRSRPIANVERVILVDREWTRGNGAPLDSSQFVTSGDELCRIILTSGSTGIPKGVAYTHDQMFEKNARLDYTRLDRWSRSARMFCDLGLSSSLGFYYVLYMLSRGGMIMLYGDEAVSTLQSFKLYEIENMATSPHGLAEYLKFYESQPTFRCGFDYIQVAGGMLTKDLAERAWASMCPNLINLYGATEVGPIALADARVTTAVTGAAGYILPDVQVQIADEANKELALGKEGIVRVRANRGISGYYGDPVASAAMFQAGWFYPGDYGYVTEDGLLIITGRQETRLNLGGDKINLETVESVLTMFPDVSDAAALTLPNPFGIEEIYALIKPQSTLDEGALRAHCQAHLQRTFVPVQFIIVDSIPRNEMGKVERKRLLELAKQKLAVAT
jgi:acyl-coenzyme A synthetase/AMP-(fatty) acid ligase